MDTACCWVLCSPLGPSTRRPIRISTPFRFLHIFSPHARGRTSRLGESDREIWTSGIMQKAVNDWKKSIESLESLF